MRAPKQKYPMVPLCLAGRFHAIGVQRFANIHIAYFGEKAISKAFDFNAHDGLPYPTPVYFTAPQASIY